MLPDAINVQSPKISNMYLELLPNKLRGVRLRQKTSGYLQLAIMRDGHPLNLNTLEFAVHRDSNKNSTEQDWDHFGWNDWNTFVFKADEQPSSGSSSESAPDVTFKVRFREASLVDKDVVQRIASVWNAERGLIRVELPSSIMSQTGVFFAEVGVFQDTALVHTSECYLYIEHSAWGDQTFAGPPSIDEVRMNIRDSDPKINELIDNFDFDIAEIAHATVETVRMWNGQPPVVAGLTYKTTNFPHRYLWMTGIQLHLFKMAEEYYRRNFFRFQAGGMSTDDKNKHREYAAAWQSRYQEFLQLMLHQKAAENMRRGFRIFGSNYPR